MGLVDLSMRHGSCILGLKVESMQDLNEYIILNK